MTCFTGEALDTYPYDIHQRNLVEWFMGYVELPSYEEAETLTAVADYLEERNLWVVRFDGLPPHH